MANVGYLCLFDSLNVRSKPYIQCILVVLMINCQKASAEKIYTHENCVLNGEGVHPDVHGFFLPTMNYNIRPNISLNTYFSANVFPKGP